MFQTNPPNPPIFSKSQGNPAAGLPQDLEKTGGLGGLPWDLEIFSGLPQNIEKFSGLPWVNWVNLGLRKKIG